MNGRAEIEGLETCWEISGLSGLRSTEFGFRVDEGFITPIKNLPSRWERKRKRKAGARGGEGCKGRREGGRQFPRQCAQMNSYELYKNSNEEKIYINHPRVRERYCNQLFQENLNVHSDNVP